MDEKIEARNEEVRREEFKEGVKAWMKNPYNLTFLGILLFAIIIRLYFFSVTSGQALWWDEADYLAYSKNLAGFPISWIITAQHNSLYPFLAAGIFAFGFGESFAKLALQVIPSVLTVFLTYFLVDKMYKDKRVALISSFLMATFWEHLFNTTRFHVDILGLFVGLLAIYIFWEGYESREKICGKIDAKWTIPITVLLVALTYSIRRGYFLFGIFFLVFMLSTRNWRSLLKDKYNWIALAIGVVMLFIIENFVFISDVAEVGGRYFHPELAINFLAFDVFPAYFSSLSAIPSVLLYLFWIGIILMVGTVALSFDKIRTLSRTKSDLFNLIAIVITLAMFIFILRTPTNFGEPRWYFPLVLGAFVAVSKSSIFILDFIKKYNKKIAIIIVVVLLGVGGYYEVQHANSIIKMKTESYMGIRDASIFIKENSAPSDIVLTKGQPQVEFYSERSTLDASAFIDEDRTSEEHFYTSLNAIKANPDIRFILITFTEPNYPDWMKKQTQSSWEIPFMDTKIDFATGQQDIKQEKSYDEITFRLRDVKQEVFIYEIIRS